MHQKFLELVRARVAVMLGFGIATNSITIAFSPWNLLVNPGH